MPGLGQGRRAHRQRLGLRQLAHEALEPGLAQSDVRVRFRCSVVRSPFPPRSVQESPEEGRPACLRARAAPSSSRPRRLTREGSPASNPPSIPPPGGRMRARVASSFVLAALVAATAGPRPGRAALHVRLPPGGVRRAPREGLRRDRGRGPGPRPGRAGARGLPALPPGERLLLPLRRRGAARVPAPRRGEPARDALPAAPQRAARAVGGEAALGRGRRARDEAQRRRRGGRDGPARRDARPLRPAGSDEGRLRAAPAGRGALGEPRRRPARGGGDGQRPLRRPPVARGRSRAEPARPLPLARDPQPHAHARRGAPA